MKITIESTSRVVEIEPAEGGPEIRCRVWEGHTESGIAVQALIPRIAASQTDDLRQFEAELQETKAPSPGVQMFPMRMIL
jgi:hypothetical protein